MIQLDAQEDKEKNIQSALILCKNAMAQGANLIVLPEVFNQRNAHVKSSDRAEIIPGPSTHPFLQFAKDQDVWILCGSVMEKTPKRQCLNTSVLINNNGKIVASYSKIHLFDVKVGKKTVTESDYFLAGEKPCLTEIMGVKVGLSICFDLRFPELYRYYAKKGAKVLFVPSSFTRPTGLAHWEVLLRSRAIENQCFVIAANQVGVGAEGIMSYGNSMLIDPWGMVLARGSDNEEEVVTATLSFQKLEQVRADFPALKSISGLFSGF